MGQARPLGCTDSPARHTAVVAVGTLRIAVEVGAAEHTAADQHRPVERHAVGKRPKFADTAIGPVAQALGSTAAGPASKPGSTDSEPQPAREPAVAGRKDLERAATAVGHIDLDPAVHSWPVSRHKSRWVGQQEIWAVDHTLPVHILVDCAPFESDLLAIHCTQTPAAAAAAAVATAGIVVCTPLPSNRG